MEQNHHRNSTRLKVCVEGNKVIKRLCTVLCIVFDIEKSEIIKLVIFLNN